MRVLLVGASGYLGGAIRPALDAAGHEDRPLSRPGADIVTGAGLAAALEGCEAVVHLAGALRGSGDFLEALHVRGTRNLVEASRAAGARRFVYVSAAGASPGGATAYQRTKARAEEAVRASDLEWTVLRPTVVFGPGGPGPNLVRQLGGVLRAAPVMPVFGDGRYLLQPVSSGNLAEGVVAALAAPARRTYDVGGPERLPYVEVLRRIAAALGRPFRPVPFPVPLARALTRLPGFPLGPEELTMLLAGNTCEAGAFFRDFGIRAERFEGR
jgi:NADH dehydrogenase